MLGGFCSPASATAVPSDALARSLRAWMPPARKVATLDAAAAAFGIPAVPHNEGAVVWDRWCALPITSSDTGLVGGCNRVAARMSCACIASVPTVVCRNSLPEPRPMTSALLRRGQAGARVPPHHACLPAVHWGTIVDLRTGWCSANVVFLVNADCFVGLRPQGCSCPACLCSVLAGWCECQSSCSWVPPRSSVLRVSRAPALRLYGADDPNYSCT